MHTLRASRCRLGLPDPMWCQPELLLLRDLRLTYAVACAGVGRGLRDHHAHEWVDHEGWGGAESREPKDYSFRVNKLSRLAKQDPAQLLHVLASQTMTENHRILPARLRALDRRKHSRLSLTAPPPHGATTSTRASVPPHVSHGLSPEPQPAGAADYHPAPFTPGKVQALHAPIGKHSHTIRLRTGVFEDATLLCGRGLS